jgi:IclR family transcriptional regulator, KDG regulon repressor
MNNTLQNGFRVLEYLSSTAQEHSVTELTEVFELPKSHICRLLKTLTETGYVEQSPITRKYKVSLRILCLANACLEHLRVRERAKPYLHRLQEALQSPVYLAVPMQGEALLIDALFPDGRETDPGLIIGKLNGPYDSATGKVCAAWLSEPEIDNLILRLPPVKKTKHTLTSPEEICRELKEVYKNKLSTTNSERSPGVSAIAAPVFSCGGIFSAAIGSSLPSGENSPETWQRFEKEIRDAAVGASFAMGDPDYGTHS